MSVPYQPQNLVSEQADGNILLSWTGSLGSTGYTIQRSTDGVNFTTLDTVGLVVQYLDELPGTGIMYYYQVAGTNGSGTSTYSSITQMVAAPPSEMSLFELRLRSKQTADRVNSEFVVTSEWNSFLRLAMYELYDILITSYEDLFSSQQVTITTNGTTANYPMPDGATNYFGSTYPSTGSTDPAPALYKLSGVDLNVNTSNITPSRVTLRKFNFIQRNDYVYPNSTSTIYGVYNMRYRLMGNNMNIIPTPAGNQTLGLWYSPKLPALLQDVDVTTLGYSGWLRYPIVRAAKYALDKEEGDTSKLDAEIVFLKTRIEQAAQGRDAGIPDTISDTRRDPVYGGSGFGSGGQGGWAIAPLGLMPGLAQNNIGYGSLIDSVHIGQLLLTIFAGLVCLAYLLRHIPRNFCRGITFAKVSNFASFGVTTFSNHIFSIIRGSSKK